jgi:type 1 glutamine amidotransferase
MAKTDTSTLVLCDDTWHPAAIIRRGLAALGDCDFAFEFMEDGEKWSADAMKKFPLVVLAKANISSSTVEYPWLTLESQAVFPDYVQLGNGLLVIHAGTSRYEKLPAMGELIGGSFLRHPDQCAVTVSPKAGHAVTAGVGAFTLRDEHYFMAMNDSRADIFLQSHSEHGVQPAGWTRTHGAGRVCVLTPGHSEEVWLHPSFQKLLSNALHWTAQRRSNCQPEKSK